MNTLIVSDIHLGSRNSQAARVSRLLQTPFDRLIVNGDTVNNLNLKKFKPKDWRILGQLREVAQKRELILIRGNHDGAPCPDLRFGPGDVLATLLGVELQEEFSLKAGGRRYLVLHGDRFDPTLHWPILTDTADWCYQTTQKVNKKVAKWLKHRVKRLGGVIELVKRLGVCYARELGYDGVITGHTHFPDDEMIDGIHYLNTGCWTDQLCTYVVADESRAELRAYEDSVPLSAAGASAVPLGVEQST
jgi:UDP-2,3-diacylglucosamine pyrophosphatase LpxH